MRLADIWREKITCIIHTSTQEEADMLFKAIDSYDHNGTTWASWWNVYKKKTCYRTNLGEAVAYGYLDNYIEDGEKVIEFSDLVATGGVVSIHDLPTSEWYNPMRLTFKNGSSIEALPNTSDIIQNTSDFCTGFRGGNIPKPVKIEVIKDKTKTVKDWVDSLSDAWAKLGCASFIMSPDEIKKMEEKKMPTKFTFYTEEGYRIDKSNNSKVETITTFVKINGFDNTYLGMATCDKVDYSEREGVINALANAMCNGNFDREFNKAVKDNARADKKARTCTYCGQLFDTVAEKETHEAWHVERRKARHERYLLRKRAKEIAFEEQAQKMAKEMTKEDK